MDLKKRIASLQVSAEKRTKNSNKDRSGDELDQNTVTKSNALARAYYRFSLVEKRVMECLLSQLNPIRHDNEIQEMTLRAVDYAKVFGVTPKSAYREIEGAINGLLEKVLRVENPSDPSGAYEKYPLMAKARYVESSGVIEAAFNPYILPHIQGLRAKFNSYPLQNAVDFQSSYTWRFYEILVSWAKPKSETGGVFAGWLTIEVSELRKMLGAPKSYNWSMFEDRVLNTSLTELREKSKVEVMIERQKTGRKITHLKIEFIEIEEKPETDPSIANQMDLPLQVTR